MPRSTAAAKARKSEEDVRGELTSVWEAWSASVSDYGTWRLGAAYIRESRKDSLQGYSPKTQLQRVLEDAASRRIYVAWENVFLDNISGRHDRRPAFLDLMALARSRRIAAVLVFHTSRFARNVGLARRWKEELRRIGVEVIAGNLRELDVTTPEGKLMETVQEAFDQYHSDSTGSWLVVSLRTKHEEGEPLGPLPETFYKVPIAGANGTVTYEIRAHPELAAIVLEGARMYVARNRGGRRYGFGDLAQWSRAQGHRTPSGRVFTDEWWRNALANPLNAGYVAYKRKQLRARGGAELRKARCEGFMPLALYQQVQQTRIRNTKSGGRPPANRVYVLTPMVCGECAGRDGGRERPLPLSRRRRQQRALLAELGRRRQP